jgi:CDP-diacylglycerol--glycerol-3-phosphate 3-phosphatidyltransferase/cardiolipin synthase
MTLANKITTLRIGLIPLFCYFGVQYSNSLEIQPPQEGLRWAAASCFLLASVLDGLDGYIARKYKQFTALGAWLDPLADKLMMLAALLLLSLTHWPQTLPLFFVILVIGRDLIAIIMGFIIRKKIGLIPLHTHWTGKWATVWQMTSISWIMVDMKHCSVTPSVCIASFFTLTAAIIHFYQAYSLIRQVKQPTLTTPTP